MNPSLVGLRMIYLTRLSFFLNIVLDLPYRFTADGDVSAGMQRMPNFDFDNLLVTALACCCFMDILQCLGGLLDDF
jgi:hypothetical protein